MSKDNRDRDKEDYIDDESELAVETEEEELEEELTGSLSQDLHTPSALSNRFEEFLTAYKDSKTKEYIYFEQISSIAFQSLPVFVLDYNDLLIWENSETLTNIFYEDIDTALATVSEAITSIIYEINPEFDSKITVRISHFDISRSFREIDAELIDRMISIDAIVNRASKKKPWLVSSVYQCIDCTTSIESPNNKQIRKCSTCESSKVIFDKKKSKYTDYKQIMVQELPEDLPPGQLPERLSVSVFGNDLTNNSRPGDRIKMTCIVRLDYDSQTLTNLKIHDPLGIKGKQFGTTFELILEANNIQKIEGFGALDNASKTRQLTDADLERIQKVKQDYYLNEKLINSFAPHIYGHEVHKEATLLEIVGCRQSTDHNGTNSRGDSHLLFVGDPGKAKSEMLKFAMKVAPRGLYTSGGGSSAAGLTAAVVKDKSGSMMLEAGAVVMADQGLCCIDEFDKMRDEDRGKLHEAMEQQTCSVAKGGIVATLNARTSLLCAANPVYGVYDPYKTISENTDLPPAMFSRFDLIYVLKDVIDLELDSRVADYMLGIETVETEEHKQNYKGKFDTEFLSKYLYYAKHLHSKSNPKLTLEAKIRIKDYFNDIRARAEKDKNNATETITATYRIVDALERLTVARARLLLKDEADNKDAERAIYLTNEMYRSFGIDIETGKVNLGLIHGKPLERMSKQNLMLEILNEISEGGKIEIDFDNLVQQLMLTRKFHTEMEAETTIKDYINRQVLNKVSGKRGIYEFNKDMIRGEY
ncbi:MAG: minichromosome maintenance protein MCM [Candidatus Nitrosocosmicus sp.]|nr:minichromosome maintenance protein MCM [Candidatus Nitrosocosmicus sp.]MDN5866021.1 minichromosome maintenance protein MCM [Candidatus Nitrosocosmicus sp.]